MTLEDDADEPQLDPAGERLRRKMVRLLAMGVGTMMLGLMAVLAAVVYRTAGPSGPEVPAEPVRIALPADADVLSSDIDGDNALLRLRSGGQDWLFLVSLSDGRVLGRYELGREP